MIGGLVVGHPSQLPDVELPPAYRGLPLAGITQSAVRHATERYLEQFWTAAAEGVAPGFFGRSGTFKTWAACVIVDVVHTTALVPSLYVAAGPEFMRLERRRFDPATDGRLQEIADRRFVVLDDITDLKPGSFAMDMLDNVVKLRDAAGLPTLYTGNVQFSRANLQPLVQQFGAGMTRRILEGTTGFLAVLG